MMAPWDNPIAGPFITIYLLIGGVLWLVSELITGASRAAYVAQIDKRNSIVMCRAVGVVAIAFIISFWPLIYGAVLINTIDALRRGEHT